MYQKVIFIKPSFKIGKLTETGKPSLIVFVDEGIILITEENSFLVITCQRCEWLRFVSFVLVFQQFVIILRKL